VSSINSWILFYPKACKFYHL